MYIHHIYRVPTEVRRRFGALSVSFFSVFLKEGPNYGAHASLELIYTTGQLHQTPTSTHKHEELFSFSEMTQGGEIQTRTSFPTAFEPLRLTWTAQV